MQEYMWNVVKLVVGRARVLHSLAGTHDNASIVALFNQATPICLMHPWRAIQVIPNPTVAPTPIPRKRSKSTIALAIVLTLFILAVLYYMIFVITVPCGAGLGGHWTIWQMVTGGGCH